MLSILERLYAFPGLSRAELQRLIASHETRNFNKNEFIAQAGQIAGQYHIVCNGLIRSYVIDPNGNEITTGFYAPGTIVIEVASLFRQEPSQENFQALTPVTLYELPFEDFQRHFREIPAFAEWGRMWMTQA